MREGTLWILPHDGCDLCHIPRRFRQRPLILTALRHLPGSLQERTHLLLIVGLLDRQDRQAVEGHADQRGQRLVLRIS